MYAIPQDGWCKSCGEILDGRRKLRATIRHTGAPAVRGQSEAVSSRPLRSLWPREHGAYAQLAAPLAAALIARIPGVAGALLALAACAAFLANEPLLVVLGHRGARRRDQDGERARRRLALATGSAVLAGAAGLVLAPRQALEVAALAAVPGAAVIVLAWRRAEHTLLGEGIAALALSGAGAPVAAADGLAVRTAIAIWIAWAIGYACTVIAVHRVIARHRSAATVRDRVAAAVLALVTIGAAVVALVVSPIALVTLPLAAIATALALRPPAATRLRAIGVALVVVSIVSGAWAVLVARCGA